MAKEKEKNKAIKLRNQGWSIKRIADKLEVSKGIVSNWCKDISLSQDAIEKLKKAQELGRKKSIEVRKKKRIEEIKRLTEEGIKEIGSLSKRDFFLAGIGIYWGEGFKSKEPGVVSSSPEIICFMRKWFKDICNIKDERFKFRISINILHKDRKKEIKKFWSKILNIPASRFQKTVFVKSKQKKIFPSRNTYYGTLVLRISRGTELRRKIRGWTEGLILEKIKKPV